MKRAREEDGSAFASSPRSAALALLQRTLSEEDPPSHLVVELEAALFEAWPISKLYRSRVRLVVAVLRRDATVRSSFCKGTISSHRLAVAKEEELLSEEQQAKRARFEHASLERSLGTNLPLGRYVMGIDCTAASCHQECERRHLDPRECQRVAWSQLSGTSLVVCAGPERSGSTWLYNAVRLLHLAAKKPCDSYWLAEISEEKLRERLDVQPPCVVCIKTHEWHDNYDALLPQHKPLIVLTHRDLRGVCASYQRVKWQEAIPDRYVADHLQWQKRCTLDIAYESFMRDGTLELSRLSKHLGLNLEHSSLCDVQQELSELRRCHLGNAVCQITKLWPDHMSSAAKSLQNNANASLDELNKFLDPAYAQVLNVRFQEYQSLYGYV